MANNPLSGIWRTEHRSATAGALALVPEPAAPTGKGCDAPGCTAPLFYSAKDGQLRGNYCAAHLVMINDDANLTEPNPAQALGVVHPGGWARRWIVPHV